MLCPNPNCAVTLTKIAVANLNITLPCPQYAVIGIRKLSISNHAGLDGEAPVRIPLQCLYLVRTLHLAYRVPISCTSYPSYPPLIISAVSRSTVDVHRTGHDSWHWTRLPSDPPLIISAVSRSTVDVHRHCPCKCQSVQHRPSTHSGPLALTLTSAPSHFDIAASSWLNNYNFLTLTLTLTLP